MMVKRKGTKEELVDEGLAMLLFRGSKRSQRTDRMSERLGSERAGASLVM